MRFIVFIAAMVACQGHGERGERGEGQNPGSRPPPPGGRPGDRPPPPPPGRAVGQLNNQNTPLSGSTPLAPPTVSPQTQPAVAAPPSVVPAAVPNVSAAPSAPAVAPAAVKAAPILQPPSSSNIAPKAKVADTVSPPKSASPITASSNTTSTQTSELPPRSEAESSTADLDQSSTLSSPTPDPNQNAAVPFSFTSSSSSGESSSSNQSSSAIIGSIVTLSLVFLCGLGYWGYNRHQRSIREKSASKEKYEKLKKLQIQDEKLLKEIYFDTLTSRPTSLCSNINSSVAPVVDSASSETRITILDPDVQST